MPLVDSDKWKSAFRSLNQLHFHPSNPRLPELPAGASEKEIIDELCLREDVEVIARSIAEKGYFRNDRLVVHFEDKRHVVYEGNRRLCALKILAKPEKAPPSMRRAIQKLAEKAKLPTKIAIEIVPTKFDAEVVMFAKHALEKFMRGWKPLQQAAFIAGKLEEGNQLEDISHFSGLKRDEIIRSLAAMDLYRFCRLADLSPDARELVNDPTKFPFSTIFERIIEPKDVREILGLEFSDRGLIIKGTPEEFVDLMKQMMEDAAAGRIDTRILNTTADALAYVKRLRYKPGEGTTTAEEAEAKLAKGTQRPQQPKKPAKQAKKRPAAQKPRTTFFPSDLICSFEHTKLTALLEEGRGLRAADAAHCAALLLRATLEIALTVWLKRHRHHHKITAMNKKHGPSLADMLGFLLQDPPVVQLDPQEKSALEALVSRRVSESKPQLDRIAHATDVTTHTEEIESIRDRAMPILRKCLGA